MKTSSASSLFLRPLSEWVKSLAMSRLTDMSEMSGLTTGAIPKTKRNNNKNNRQAGAEDRCFWENLSGASGFTVNAAVVARSSSEPPSSKKRNTNFLSEEGEGVVSKRPKYDDIPVHKKFDTKIYWNLRQKRHKKNREFKDQPVDEDMEVGSEPTLALKRKAGKNEPNPKDDEGLMKTDIPTSEKINDIPNNGPPQILTKRRCQKKHTKRDTKDEPKNKKGPSKLSEDELTEVLGNMQIEPSYKELSTMVPTWPKPCKPKRENCAFCKSNPECNPKNPNEFDLKKVAKWTEKKWNKDRRGATCASSLNSSVVIQNLPVGMTTVYQQKLSELFEKYGPIKWIGYADVRPSDDGETTFNTTIHFESENSATKALEEDNTRFGGSVIRVRRPLPQADYDLERCYDDVPLEDLRMLYSHDNPTHDAMPFLRRNSGLEDG